MLKVNYLDKSDKAEAIADRIQHKANSATRLWYSLVEKAECGYVNPRKLKHLGNISQARARLNRKHVGGKRTAISHGRHQTRTFQRVYL